MSYVVSHIINCNARKIIDFSTNVGQEPLQKNNCQNEGANSYSQLFRKINTVVDFIGIQTVALLDLNTKILPLN